MQGVLGTNSQFALDWDWIEVRKATKRQKSLRVRTLSSRKQKEKKCSHFLKKVIALKSFQRRQRCSRPFKNITESKIRLKTVQKSFVIHENDYGQHDFTLSLLKNTIVIDSSRMLFIQTPRYSS
jgi:hypothetical protein